MTKPSRTRCPAFAPWMLLCWTAACTPQGDPPLEATGFHDDFERDELGPAWHNTGGPYELVAGELRAHGARNRPLWLRRRLPDDVRIEFDVHSESKDGDIKVEVFGDGHSHATTTSYTATSYVVIFGGWNNRYNVLARMDEHGKDRIEGPRFPVEQGTTYHMKIERQAGHLRVWANDTQILELDDPKPLRGKGHDHFAFNNWRSDVYFDNLHITTPK